MARNIGIFSDGTGQAGGANPRDLYPGVIVPAGASRADRLSTAWATARVA